MKSMSGALHVFDKDFHTLRYANKFQRPVHQMKQSQIGRILEYTIDGFRYKVIGPGKGFDIASHIDTDGKTTYWMIDPKFKRVLGQL